MKLLLLSLIFSFSFFGCVVVTDGQIKPSATGTVGTKNPPTPEPRRATSEISKTDFRNYTFPVPNVGNLERTFTLYNGTSAKKAGAPNFKLRKTYHFDLTGDRADEAITHITADGCQLGCESSSLFFVYTLENKQPKLIWKIAIGGDVMGGLKAAYFSSDEIVLEIFGDAYLEDWIIRSEIDVKKNPQLKTNTYSRFAFSLANGWDSPATKMSLPLGANINVINYRSKIFFGEPD